MMDSITAIEIAEGTIECEEAETLNEAWQHLIDTGLAWSLQGWFGRTAAHLIDMGTCKRSASTVEGNVPAQLN
jgi:hypothetical protein